ncbi:MAG: transposase family protein [Colwellia sp.]|nr:transposase family protein [Colwellia sp.]
MSSLFLIDRAFGLVRYASIGWAAATPDITILKQCALFGDQRKSDAFFQQCGRIVTDQGFSDARFPDIVCPIASKRSAAGLGRWNQLTDDEKEWSSRISAIEAGAENVFAQIFHNEFQLVRRFPQGLCKNADVVLPKIILAATILYNMQILEKGRCIFDPIIS